MSQLAAWKMLVVAHLPKLRHPHGNLGYNGFLKYARKLPDRHKTHLRRMLACLDINGYLNQDNKMTYALWTEVDRKAHAARGKNRRRLEKLGLVQKGDGKHIHHKNGNTNDNRLSNLMVVDGKKHRRAHTESNHRANIACEYFIQKMKTNGTLDLLIKLRSSKRRTTSKRATRKS